MKKIILSLLMLVPMLVVAQEEAKLPNTLLVILNDGTGIEYALLDAPELSFSGTDLVVKCDETTVSFTRDEIARYNVVYRDYNEVTGLCEVVGERNIVRTGDNVIVHSLKVGSPVNVYGIDGRLVSTHRADTKGEVNVSLAGLGQGIYLLNINDKYTTKIIKQ